ncbi:DDIT3 protein, partial [Centropus unirufus]|nr:DDIT3 protein [Centropus unirufus]
PGGCPLLSPQAPPWGSEAAELLGTEPPGPPSSAPSGVSPTRLKAAEDEEGTGGRGVKRKRCGGPGASREAAEQRVQELTEQNARLREEIGRLSAEVQRTRAALIDHIVSLRRA